MMLIDPVSRSIRIDMCEDALTHPRHVAEPNNPDAVKLRSMLAELRGTNATQAAPVEEVRVGRAAGSATSNQYGTFAVHAATDKQVAFAARLLAEKASGVKVPTTLDGISKTSVSALIDKLINRPSKLGAPAANAASEKQVELLLRLASEKVLSNLAQGEKLKDRSYVERLSKADASKLIDFLFGQKNVSAPKTNDVWTEIASLAASVPVDGEAKHDSLRFALLEGGETRFYQLDRPTQGRWAGYVFLNIQASDDLHPIRDAVRIKRVLADLTADVKNAVARYGLEIGKCGHCGRTLTNEESRQIGIGPVCRTKMGW